VDPLTFEGEWMSWRIAMAQALACLRLGRPDGLEGITP
jgi:hypothetical protein